MGIIIGAKLAKHRKKGVTDLAVRKAFSNRSEPKVIIRVPL